MPTPNASIFRFLMILICGLLINLPLAQAQEDCGSAIGLSIGTSVSGDNVGALPDNDYSAQTSCNSANYEAAVWYSFITPAGTTSLNFTFSAGTIGPNTVLTIVDDCTNNSSNSYLWNSCNGNIISGSTDIFCNLTPSTTYYIQVASTAGNAGTFDIEIAFNPLSPPNDFCEGAIVVFDGFLDCGEFEILPGNANACPDVEATGNCLDSNSPGVWYTFQVPDDMEYSGFFTNPLNTNFELFSTTTGCDDLQYENCGGYILFSSTPGTTYYLLVENDLNIQALVSAFSNECTGPDNTMNTGAGTGETDFGLNSCASGSDIMPCQNDNVVWYSYTVGCSNADLEISLEIWDLGNGQEGQIIDGGLMAIEDCSTIMSEYDLVNGDGYVCSAIVGSDILILTNVPGGTSFNIAVGSDNPFQGYYDVTVMEDPYFDAILLNDDCDDAIEIEPGMNEDFHNNCADPDIPFINCPPQGQATVWFEYTPTFDLEDITINLISDGIITSAIGAYENCNGLVIGQFCGTSLELQCISETIYIDIGSSTANTGYFDLELIVEEAVESPQIEFDLDPICSYDLSSIELSLPGGLSGTFTIQISSTSSSDIDGMQGHIFQDENFVVINDELINCGSSTENAVYLVTVLIDGFNCESTPIEVPLPVFPKLEADPLFIDVCLPHLLNLNADDIIDGGSEPYADYTWWWNGSVNLSDDDELVDYNLTESGFIELEVIDDNGCSITTQIPVEVHEIVEVELSIDNDTACPGNPDFININADLPIEGGTIVFSSWTILDASGNPVSFGIEGNSNLQIETEGVASGEYFVTVIVESSFGCILDSDQISFTIHPIPFGAIELISVGDCQQLLQIVFYDDTGFDIYNNGPDFNGDGIPDLFDQNDDGVADFLEIKWYSPMSGIFTTNELTFIPFEDGVYSAEIITDYNCVAQIMGLDVDIDNQNIPTITAPSNICENEMIVLSVSPTTFISYVWMNEDGIIVGENGTEIQIDPLDLMSVYSVEVLDQNGCVLQAMTNITINPAPEIELSGSTSICPGQSTVLDGGGDPQVWTYDWFDSGDNLLLGDTSSIEIFLPDQYMLIVTNEFGCMDTILFEVDENADLDIDIVGEDLCSNGFTELDGGIGMDTYQWTNLGGELLGSTQLLETDTAGSYVLYVELGLCTGIDTILISEIPPPNLEIPETIDICNGDNASINTMLDFNTIASSSDPGQWMSLDLPTSILDDLASVDFEQIAVGNYSFVYTTSMATFPCVNMSDTIQVIVSDCPCPSPEINDFISLCNTEDQFNLDIQLLPTTSPGVWSFLDGPESIVFISSSVIVCSGLAAGEYLIVYELDPEPMDSCPNQDTLTIEVIAPPIVTFADPPDLCNITSPIASSIINLDDMIISGSGIWLDPIIPNLDFNDPNNLDFDGVLPGQYDISFMTNNASAPCGDIVFDITLTVLDCNCPIVSVDETATFCNDAAVVSLDIFEGNSEIGSWSAATGNPSMVSITANQLDLNGSQDGIYNLIYTLDNPVDGCPVEDTLALILHPAPVIMGIRDTLVCNEDLGNGGTTIDLTNLVVGDNGQWYDQNNVLVQNPNQVQFSNSGIGSVFEFTYETFSAVDPCMNVLASSFITVIDCACDEPTFGDAPILCNADTEPFDLNELVLSSHDGTWIIIDQPPGTVDPIAGSLFSAKDILPGIYTTQFIMTDDPGFDCQFIWEFQVEVVQARSAILTTDDGVCTSNFNGDIVRYNLYDAIVSGATDGYWIDSDGAVVDNPSNLDFLNADPSVYNYAYVLENDLPCEDLVLPFNLLAEPCSAEIIDTVIFLPNIFSPNGDGINDELIIESNIEDLIIKQFIIYDRWGNLIYSLEDKSILDPLAAWNGRLNGQIVASGVYAYYIEADVGSSNSQNSFAGSITVIR